MAQDIEEFLRLAAARKKQQQQAKQQPPPQPPQQTNRPNQPSAPQRPSPPPQSPPDLYISDEEAPVPTLAPSIRTNVSTADIAEHTSHLGETVHSRHDMTEVRVHEKFDHDLGRLHKDDLEDPEVVDHGLGNEASIDISAMLNLIQNPRSLKQAIILKEIFDRPNFD